MSTTLLPPFTGPSTDPVSPRRVVTLSRDTPPEETVLVERGREVLRGRSHRGGGQPTRWAGWNLTLDKIDLLVRIVDRLVRHYDRADLWESWLVQVGRREDLASGGIGRHIAILDYRLQVPVAVDR